MRGRKNKIVPKGQGGGAGRGRRGGVGGEEGGSVRAGKGGGPRGEGGRADFSHEGRPHDFCDCDGSWRVPALRGSPMKHIPRGSGFRAQPPPRRDQNLRDMLHVCDFLGVAAQTEATCCIELSRRLVDGPPRPSLALQTRQKIDGIRRRPGALFCLSLHRFIDSLKDAWVSTPAASIQAQRRCISGFAHGNSSTCIAACMHTTSMCAHVTLKLHLSNSLRKVCTDVPAHVFLEGR